MKKLLNNRISLIGMTLELGAGTKGISLGPSAIRYAGVIEKLENLGYEVEDKGDIVSHKLIKKSSDSFHENLHEIVRVNQLLCEKVSSTIRDGSFPLILGGDHSLSIGSLAGVLQHKENPGLIWFDAHGDINTEETSPSGNIHGMPVAVALGLGHEKLISIGGKDKKLKKGNIVYIGCRDLDIEERRILKELNINVFTMHDIDKRGMAEVVKEAIDIAIEGTDGIHVSFDMDCMDPVYARGTGTRVPGGLTYRESHFALEMISSTKKLISAEFVEVNPIIDNHNQTAKTAVSLIGSLMGEWLI